MRVRLAAALLVVAAALGIVLASSATALADIDGPYFYGVIGGQATIYLYSGTDSTVTIPSTLGGAPVTTLQGFGTPTLKCVTIPDTVKTISSAAFFGSGLTSVTIPDSVTSVECMAFESCPNLAHVNIGTGVHTIANSAFAHSGLSSVTIPDGVTSIEDGAFENCPSLSHVSIGKGVTSIGRCAFCGDSALTALAVPPNVQTLSDQALAKTGLLSFTIPHTLTQIGDGAFAGSALASITIFNPSGSLGKQLFWSCPNLARVVVAQGSTSIPNSAFMGCGALSQVTISQTVTEIGDLAFEGSGLASITIPDSVEVLGADAFQSCSNLTDVRLGKGLKTIGAGAFSYVPLKSIVIPEGVQTIGGEAFAESGLNAVDIPDSVTTVGEAAFEYCPNLAHVTLGKGIVSIETIAFQQDPALTEVSIPGNVKSVGMGAFGYCYNLSRICIGNGVASIGDNAFWAAAVSTVTIPASVSSMGPNVFAECDHLVAARFLGDAPAVGATPFGAYPGPAGFTIYYRRGAKGFETVGPPPGPWPETGAYATAYLPPCRLTYLTGPHGSVRGTSSQSVEYGASGEAVVAVPAKNFRFARWSDGAKSPVRQDKNVTHDATYSAEFVPVLKTSIALWGDPSIRTGRVYRLRGFLWPGCEGGSMRVELSRWVHKKWRPVAFREVGIEHGRLSYSVRVKQRGRWKVSVYYRGQQTPDAMYCASTARRLFAAK